MPTYVYKCSDCDIIEVQQSVYESSLIRCPECGSEDFSKKFISAGVQFKGSGFYSTDSRDK